MPAVQTCTGTCTWRGHHLLEVLSENVPRCRVGCHRCILVGGPADSALARERERERERESERQRERERSDPVCGVHTKAQARITDKRICALSCRSTSLAMRICHRCCPPVPMGGPAETACGCGAWAHAHSVQTSLGTHTPRGRNACQQPHQQRPRSPAPPHFAGSVGSRDNLDTQIQSGGCVGIVQRNRDRRPRRRGDRQPEVPGRRSPPGPPSRAHSRSLRLPRSLALNHSNVSLCRISLCPSLSSSLSLRRSLSFPHSSSISHSLNLSHVLSLSLS